MFNNLNLATYSMNICNTASRGIFDFSLNLPHSLYLQSVPYVWPQLLFATAKTQLRILHANRAVQATDFDALHSLETETLLSRYVKWGKPAKNGLRRLSRH